MIGESWQRSPATSGAAPGASRDERDAEMARGSAVSKVHIGPEPTLTPLIADTDKAVQWNVSADALCDAESVALTEFGTDNTGTIFLLAKGVAWPSSMTSHHHIDQDDQRLMEPNDPAAIEWRVRLDQLLTTDGYLPTDDKPDACQPFHDFLEACCAWKGNGAYELRSLFNDDVNSAVGWMRPPPVVIQHYLLSMPQPEV